MFSFNKKSKVFHSKTLCQILPEIFDILNPEDTYIRIDDTKSKITSKLKYSTLLKCLKRDLRTTKN